MLRNFVRKLNIFPSWVILFFDFFCVIIATVVAVILRNNFNFSTKLTPDLYLTLPLIILGISAFYFLLFGTHKMIVRYSSVSDVLRILLACFLATVTLFFLNIILFIISNKYLVPMSIIGMEFFIVVVLITSYRLLLRIYYIESLNPTRLKKNIVIFGAGDTGITTKSALDRDTGSKYNVLAFFDDDHGKTGLMIEGLPVLSTKQMSSYFLKNDISFVIISIQNISAGKKNEITEIALQYNAKVLMVPPVNRWINGELSFKQIKKIKIEDLLERDPIMFDKSFVGMYIINKTILITGAAGSIGSEIVRQLIKFNYKRLILVDNAETPVFFLTNECKHAKHIDIFLQDITDEIKMEELIAQYRPQIIYHAAAYKHVPLMEENVSAAIKVNVEGTKILADLSVKYGVEKFVMVSTDKAVNPTNVMGASKRIAEIYVQSLNFHQNTTKFITTRFGNVLGSNGSVIPVFREQIKMGGPITVTDPNITRFFMTIPEACQLVIIAGSMGVGGEIFIFDMGESVKIYDLAVKMIKLSGLTLGKDIQIIFTGLRDGEKLHEELFANQENAKKTNHKKIMIAHVRRYEYSEVEQNVNNLITLKNDNPYIIVKKMKEIVPEFKSQHR